MKKPLIIISFDGLATEDIAYLREKPGFKRFLAHASGSAHVKSIYPSVTYPAHASIITGCYPRRHGIVDNTKNQPERYQNPDWFWYKKDIKVETLYEIAKQKGYSVGALLWPTTGRADIDYNMPEIFRLSTRYVIGSLHGLGQHSPPLWSRRKTGDGIARPPRCEIEPSHGRVG